MDKTNDKLTISIVYDEQKKLYYACVPVDSIPNALSSSFCDIIFRANDIKGLLVVCNTVFPQIKFVYDKH